MSRIISLTTQKMVNTLSSFGVEVKILANQSSIFEAYKKGMDLCDAKDGDIIILCHDDIELPLPSNNSIFPFRTEATITSLPSSSLIPLNSFQLS